MRILQVNKFYYPRGGADKYFINLSQALERAGNEVAIFSMAHPKNLPSDFSSYFVSRISFNNGSWRDKFKIPVRIIYNFEAKKKFQKLINDFQPDIIHIHNIYHQISPSILDTAKKSGIPVVMHLHDYKLICPNYQLFVNGEICEACKPQRYYKCTQKKCLKNSRTKSLLATIEIYLHNSVWKIYKRNINLFIAPSVFMKQKITEFGWPADKIKVIINPFSPELNINKNEEAVPEENYLLYFGRLSKEKGLTTLLEAAVATNSQLKFAGHGPEEENLKKYTQDKKIDAEFLGFKEGKELLKIILKAKTVIIPSLWYENMPLSLLEALSLGKLVIASNIGGIPEIIKDGENGLLFKPGNISDLIAKIKLLETINAKEIKKRAKESVIDFTITNNLNEVLEVYREILKNKKSLPI
jgi:glycosyltransferase involved in cell wall biosynthesis